MSGKKSRGPSVSADLEEEYFKAADNGDKEDVKKCLAKGVDVNATSTKSWRRVALHMAAEGGHVHIAELLIAKGAAINTKDDFCETPLHIAASQGEFPMVQLLVSTPGVDVLAKNEDGKTALELSGTDQMIRRVLKKREQDQRQSELMAKTGGVKIKRRIKCSWLVTARSARQR
ncbi:myotrophin homolog [Branchiostoma floridae x Branchiostoma japonicum]